ncbi:ABC transporter substrate-binding protein [Candidatus Riflebacteria bacterium]
MNHVLQFLLILLLFFYSLEITGAKEKRIICLSPGITEIVSALGKVNDIVGRTRYCNFPETVLKAEVVGGLHVSIEKILVLDPDVIFTQKGFHQKEIPQLLRLNLQVMEVRLNTIADLFQAFQIIGKELAVTEKARLLSKKIKRSLWRIKKKHAGKKNSPSVFLQINKKPLMGAGRNTFMHDLLTICGAKNIFARKSGYFPVNKESLLLLDPDVIFITYPTRPFESSSIIKVLKKKMVFNLEPDISTRPGPRILKAARAICLKLYPDEN